MVLGTLIAASPGEARTQAEKEWTCYGNQYFTAKSWMRSSAAERSSAGLSDLMGMEPQN